MGVYGASTFHQGDAVTPDAHPAPASSKCAGVGSISNGAATLSIPATTTASHSSLDLTVFTTLFISSLPILLSPRPRMGVYRLLLLARLSPVRGRRRRRMCLMRHLRLLRRVLPVRRGRTLRLRTLLMDHYIRCHLFSLLFGCICESKMLAFRILLLLASCEGGLRSVADVNFA